MTPAVKKEIVAVMDEWAKTFSDDNPDPILALYDEEAVLWGTLSPSRRDNPAAVRDYFVKAFVALPSRKVIFKDSFIRVYDDMAINTGYYTFSWMKEGQLKELPARYSFTYVKRDEGWMIVDHHSSAMPDPNLAK